MTTDLFNALKFFKEKIETEIKKDILTFGPKTPLRDACEYALLNGGKRFRPALVYIVAESLGNHYNVNYGALTVEYFHTASLIADDLPCMDNDDFRRDKPTLHKAHGEAIALLASYALIAKGYENLAKNIKENNYSDDRGIIALENISQNTGILGATGGQYLDIFPPKINFEVLLEANLKKTVTLFEISFVLGWLLGGGSIELLEKVKKAASHFGLAFQIADDLEDFEEDKQNNRKVNLALYRGKEEAQKMFHVELDSFVLTIKELNLNPHVFQKISELLKEKTKK